MNKHTIVYFSVSMAIGIIFGTLLPFPMGLATAMPIFIGFSLVYRKYVLKSDGLFSFGNTGKIKFNCVICGKSTNKRFCPRCGGNQFKTT